MNVTTSCGCSSGTNIPLYGNLLDVCSLLGCDAGYFDDQKLLDVPVKLAAKGKKDFSIETDDTCTLSRSYYVHDYSCFWSRWRNVSDGFFNIDVKKHHFEIEVSYFSNDKLQVVAFMVEINNYI